MSAFSLGSGPLHAADGCSVQTRDRLELMDALLQTLGRCLPIDEGFGGHQVQRIARGAELIQ